MAKDKSGRGGSSKGKNRGGSERGPRERLDYGGDSGGKSNYGDKKKRDFKNKSDHNQGDRGDNKGSRGGSDRGGRGGRGSGRSFDRVAYGENKELKADPTLGKRIPKGGAFEIVKQDTPKVGQLTRRQKQKVSDLIKNLRINYNKLMMKKKELGNAEKHVLVAECIKLIGEKY